jgi:hypothetical protein
MKKKQVFSGGTCQSADIAASVYVLRNALHSCLSRRKVEVPEAHLIGQHAALRTQPLMS